MKNNPTNLNLDTRLFGILIMPSWLSGIIDVIIGLVVVIGTIFLSRYQGSSVRVDYLNYLSGNQSQLYKDVNTGILSNQFVSNLPLILFWGLIGIIVYLFATNIFAAVRNTAQLRSELEYANVDRHSLLVQAGQHLVIRIVVLVAWILYIRFFFYHVLPYCIAATLAGLSQVTTPLGIGYIVLAFVVMIVALHIHTIMLRLLLLKPRLFTKALYVD